MKRVGFILLITALASLNASAEWNMRDITGILPADQAPAGTVAWGDVNRDGQTDLFVGGWNGAGSRLFLRGDRCFTNVTDEYDVGYLSNVTSAQFVDYDQDGRLDLLCLLDNIDGVAVMHQTEQGDFEAVPLLAGLPFTEPVRSAVWADVNNDGALDLILSNGGGDRSPIGIFVQESGEFVPQRDGLEPFNGRAGAITYCDEDKDGDVDYFFGAYGTSPVRLYRWQNGEYVDEAWRYQFPPMLGSTSVVWLDFNNDRMLDLFCCNPAGMPYLYMGGVQEGVRTLKRVPDEVGLRSAYRGVYAHAVDADMDGWTDLFVTTKNGNSCTLMRNVRGQYWEDQAENLGLANPLIEYRDGGWADFDQDGDLDLAVACGRHGVRLYRNDLKHHNEFVAVRLLARGYNSPAMNCQVIVDYDGASSHGGTYQSTSAQSCDDQIVYLASRQYEPANEVTLWVQWSNGIQRVYEADQFERNAITTLIEPVGEIPDVSAVPNMTAPQPPIADLGNAPNPFNPTTTISFTLTEAVSIELKVFDMSGREVAVLARGEYAAGIHRRVFEAAGLPSGMYFARLTAGADARLTRLILTK